ncbi:MAG: hypothetical protein WA628_14195 [Terriglobales bacterium]
MQFSAPDHAIPLPTGCSTRFCHGICCNEKTALNLSCEYVGYLAVFTLRNNDTGAVVQTADPGRALITGKWTDIGKVEGPVLRGLASRAPYFHNGSAATLADVVLFYDMRFNIGFTPQEKADLIAFLNSL